MQVVLGEMRGAGVKTGARCMWDSDADSHASVEFENVSKQIKTCVNFGVCTVCNPLHFVFVSGLAVLSGHSICNLYLLIK